MTATKSIVIALAAIMAPASAIAATPLYLDDTKPIEQRVDDALARMTLEEKVAVLHAQSKFSSAGVPRLGIPGLWATDGPHGIRAEVLWDEWDQAGWTNDSCTAFPALTALAATWNPDMALLYGRSIGEEARYRGKDILLGPGVNICRTPLNGRNFEYMGEDPCLASAMVVPYIQGVQQNGVAACVKHYALNNHERDRHNTNVIVDDRTLYEIYLPAFKAAVQQGGAWSIMGSYNLYEDTHVCHNTRLLDTILRDEWGFDGVVVSDWGGVHDTDEVIAAGLDLEFGSWTDGLNNGITNAYDSYHMANPYLDRLRDGRASVADLDRKVRRILRLAMRTAMNRNRPYGRFVSPEHSAAARAIGAEGIVLLRNHRHLLPIPEGKKILVVGENAIKSMIVGGGSSSLKSKYEISPLDGIRARFGASRVDYARGYVGDTGGEYNGVSSGQNLADARTPAQLRDEAVEKARRADCVIFIGGLNKAAGQDCEDSDRDGLSLPYAQDSLIEALAQANPALVVVNISGNPVAMPWAQRVPAIIQAWHLGSESGNALADIISGDVNPSGKLPMTFPARLADVGAHALGAYPGTQRPGSRIIDCSYDEGILVGYRWHDTRKIKPLFPFGHGLSYTTFAYGKPAVHESSDSIVATITIPVTNTGSRHGAEVVQLYISDHKSSLPRPLKELKDFRKISLAPGETADVTFRISRSALAFFDPATHSWVAEPGRFTAHIGSSSADIRATASFNLK